MHFDKRMIIPAFVSVGRHSQTGALWVISLMSVIVIVKLTWFSEGSCLHYRRLGFEGRNGGNRAFMAFIFSHLYIDPWKLQTHLSSVPSRQQTWQFQVILGSFGSIPIGL